MDCPGCQQPIVVLSTCPHCGLSRATMSEVQRARSRWAESQVNEEEVDQAELQRALRENDEHRNLLSDVRERLRLIVGDIEQAVPPPTAWIEGRSR
jgi:hypothetical protein